MTARLSKPVTTPTPPTGLRGEAAASRGAQPVGPDALAALLQAQQAVTRQEAALHLFDAITHGLPAADAQQALVEWEKANDVQQIGGAR